MPQRFWFASLSLSSSTAFSSAAMPFQLQQLLLLSLAASASALCFDQCQANCSAAVKLACAADASCGGFSQHPCYVPDSYVLSLCNTFSLRGAPCASKPRAGGNDNWYYYLDPQDNTTWLGGQDHFGTCSGASSLPNISGWSGVCPLSPTVPSDCPSRPRPAERLVSIWQPGFSAAMGQQIVAGVAAHPGTFNAFSSTWAFWNSPWNARCNNSYQGTGLCGEAFDNSTWATVQLLNESYGLAPVPIVETCCLCVLNASYDFSPAMARLVADAVQHGFGGYAVDIECGGATVVDELRFRAFMDAFGGAMRALGKSISWWVHYNTGPEASFPNAASYIYTMDSYDYTTPAFVGPWINEFQCQAGIGLEFPGNGRAADLSAMFQLMADSPTLQAAGVWGFLPNNSEPLTELWWAGMKQFRDGWKPEAASGSGLGFSLS
jgi:hypothetical protein